MPCFTVFHNNEVFVEYDVYPMKPKLLMPSPAYIFNARMRQWVHHKATRFTIVDEKAVPGEVRALALVLAL